MLLANNNHNGSSADTINAVLSPWQHHHHDSVIVTDNNNAAERTNEHCHACSKNNNMHMHISTNTPHQRTTESELAERYTMSVKRQTTMTKRTHMPASE